MEPKNNIFSTNGSLCEYEGDAVLTQFNFETSLNSDAVDLYKFKFWSVDGVQKKAENEKYTCSFERGDHIVRAHYGIIEDDWLIVSIMSCDNDSVFASNSDLYGEIIPSNINYRNSFGLLDADGVFTSLATDPNCTFTEDNYSWCQMTIKRKIDLEGKKLVFIGEPRAKNGCEIYKVRRNSTSVEFKILTEASTASSAVKGKLGLEIPTDENSNYRVYARPIDTSLKISIWGCYGNNTKVNNSYGTVEVEGLTPNKNGVYIINTDKNKTIETLNITFTPKKVDKPSEFYVLDAITLGSEYMLQTSNYDREWGKKISVDSAYLKNFEGNELNIIGHFKPAEKESVLITVTSMNLDGTKEDSDECVDYIFCRDYQAEVLTETQGPTIKYRLYYDKESPGAVPMATPVLKTGFKVLKYVSDTGKEYGLVDYVAVPSKDTKYRIYFYGTGFTNINITVIPVGLNGVAPSTDMGSIVVPTSTSNYNYIVSSQTEPNGTVKIVLKTPSDGTISHLFLQTKPKETPDNRFLFDYWKTSKGDISPYGIFQPTKNDDGMIIYAYFLDKNTDSHNLYITSQTLQNDKVYFINPNGWELLRDSKTDVKTTLNRTTSTYYTLYAKVLNNEEVRISDLCVVTPGYYISSCKVNGKDYTTLDEGFRLSDNTDVIITVEKSSNPASNFEVSVIPSILNENDSWEHDTKGQTTYGNVVSDALEEDTARNILSKSFTLSSPLSFAVTALAEPNGIFKGWVINPKYDQDISGSFRTNGYVDGWIRINGNVLFGTDVRDTYEIRAFFEKKIK